MGLNLFFTGQALGLEISSTNYTAGYIEFLQGGGYVGSSNKDSQFTAVGGNFGNLQELSSTNFSGNTGQPALFSAAAVETSESNYITNLAARTEALGAGISEGMWHRDNDPYFSWDVIVTPTDLLEGYSISLDNEPDFTVDVSDTHYQYGEDAITSGKHVFYVLPSLRGGAWDNTERLEFHIWVDSALPVIDQIQPASGQILTDNMAPVSCRIMDTESGLDLNVTTLDLNDSRVIYTYDAASQLLTYSPSSALNEGKNSVMLTAYDLVGNNFTKGWDFIVDTQPPTGSIAINGAEQYAHSPYVLINVSASDAVTGIKNIFLSNDGEFDTELLQPYPYATVIKNWLLDQPDVEGLKTVYARFQDNAGNISEIYKAEINLKLLVPDTRIISGPSSITEDTSADFKYEATLSACKFSYKIDNQPWSDWSDEKEASFGGLAEGNHYFFVKSAIDLNADAQLTLDEQDSTPSMWVWTVKPQGYIEKLKKRILFWRR